ncbi:MAG: S9 family peptidase [Gemmatimonadetes bacterium]|nr:S9 family peptidase [Gemmatimonadota bacterium]
MKTQVAVLAGVLALFAMAPGARAQSGMRAEDTFQPLDVFQLEWASDPEISPDGRQVVFVRQGYDIMKDDTRSALWIMNVDGTGMRALGSGDQSYGSPRWSPDGGRLLFVSNKGGSRQLWMRWMDTGQEAELTHLADQSPSGITWSPDGKWIALTMFVAQAQKPMITMPPEPKGADWGPPWRVIDRLHYRQDEIGWLPRGYTHVFVLPAEGGTPRQITFGDYNDGSPAWSADGKSLFFVSDRHEDWQYDPANSEIYEVSLAGGEPHALTSRQGPDNEPTVSPDGRLIAYTGYDDKYVGYQVTHLYVMNRDGSGKREVAGSFDRDFRGLSWSRDGKGLFFQYDDQGDTKIGYVDVSTGKVTKLADHVGGLSIGRPYGGGSYSVSNTGVYAFTHSLPDHPADVAVGSQGRPERRITYLNADLLDHKTLATSEEIHFKSSYDGRDIQGWILKPPHFDPSHKYPLILEIHGGPFANYGDRFAAEDQLYAAPGNVVLYLNPRGSTSYGAEFGNLIDRDYPDHDFDDLMSGVDAVVAKGYVDPSRLYVTGGSGGGVLTAWIVGHTDRFKAAVVQKPVINWYSFVLNSDEIPFFYKYWMPGLPWDNLQKYMARSPISYAGNVKTPTMLITGEEDHRTPTDEAEQFYGALKIRKVPTVMVKVPDSGHEISLKPSNLVEKTVYVLAWFRKWGMSGG